MCLEQQQQGQQQEEGLELDKEQLDEEGVMVMMCLVAASVGRCRNCQGR